MADNREPQKWTPEQQKDIARRRDELLAAARGEGPKGGGGGANLAGIGFQFAGAVLVFMGAGWFLDKKLGSGPWAMLAGMLLGLGVGFYVMVKSANAERRREESGK